MAVSIGDVISADQYNSLVNKVNKWFGDNYSTNTHTSSKATSSYGWGNTPVSEVIIEDPITAEQFNHLIQRINMGRTRTGVGGATAKVLAGDPVLAADYNNIEAISNAIDNVRTTTTQSTITSGGVDDQVTRGVWENTIVITAVATFTSYAKARYFFNSGGQLRLYLTNDGLTVWGGLEDMGTLIFSYEDFSYVDATRTGTVVSGSGFYELTESPREVYSVNLDSAVYGGAYDEEDVTVSVSINSSGTQISLTFTCSNGTSSAYGTYGEGGGEVDGNTTIFLDTRLTTGGSVSLPSVTYSITPPVFEASSWSGS